jgi:hypothetical protein
MCCFPWSGFIDKFSLRDHPNPGDRIFDRNQGITRKGNASLKRGSKSVGLILPQTELPKTLESGFVEMIMGHSSYRRIVFPKVPLINLGQSAVTALKFISDPPVAGSNRM